MTGGSQHKKRVSLLGYTLGGGGADRMLFNLANEFSRRNLSVDLVLFMAEGHLVPELSERVNLHDLQTPAIDRSGPHRRTPRLLEGVYRLWKLLRKVQPEVVISTGYFPNLACTWVRSFSRLDYRVYLREGQTLSLRTGDRNSLMDRLMPSLVKWTYPLADRVFANSPGVADDLRSFSGVPEHLIDLLPNPTLPDDFSKQPQPVPEDPWLENGRPTIVGAGRLHPRKDFTTLIKAFARIRKSIKADLLILGEGEQRKELEELISSKGLEHHVRLPGYQRNIYGYLAAADLFVLSSRYEGMPSTLIEAMACGTPVVATDCRSGPRELLDGGEIAPLVPVKDVNAMAEAIRGVLRKPPDPDVLVRAVEPHTVSHVVDLLLKSMKGVREPT